jgi:hypothetical protein
MSAPLTYLERKWASGQSGNKLYESGIQTTDRKAIAPLDYDTHRNVSSIARRTMLTIGRWVYSNVPQVRGAVNEIATYTSSHFIAQFDGEDQAWGEEAEAWLRNHDLICDVKGWPFNMATLRRNVVLSFLRDCDCGILFCDTPAGYPQLQFIPGHRIGGRLVTGSIVEGGDYDGRRIIDGVIVGDFGQPLAYRIYAENNANGNFVDVPARDMKLCFIPEYGDQVRGVSQIATNIFDWQDIAEYRKFELLAQKIGASIALIEENENGEALPGDNLVLPDPTSVTTGTPTGLITESYDGGTTRYFRSKSGNRLTGFQNDRPSNNQQAFEDKITRAAFSGMGWSMDFSLDPTKAGGAQMRVVVEKINRQIELIQDMLIAPLMRSIDGWRISKAIKLGQLRPSPEWYKWTYQGPSRLTADEKYSSDVAINELRSGIACQQDVIAKRGGDWRALTKAQIRYRDFLNQECAKTKTGVKPAEIVWPSPNGDPTLSIEAAADEAQETPADETASE